jgi:hypothetical protein
MGPTASFMTILRTALQQASTPTPKLWRASACSLAAHHTEAQQPQAEAARLPPVSRSTCRQSLSAAVSMPSSSSAWTEWAYVTPSRPTARM